MDSLAGPTTCKFNGFLLDMHVRVLFRVDSPTVTTPIPLGSRAFDILCLLVEHRGGLVPKQKIMDAVWPNLVVAENNLTVQISALRRVLDVGLSKGSSIQTIPGRGYRFLPPVTTEPDTARLVAVATPIDAAESRPPAAPQDLKRQERVRRRRRWPRVLAIALLALGLGAGALMGWDLWARIMPSGRAPRLSIVVLPFQNLSGNPAEDYLADGITDDLTSDLSHIPEAFVIARESAYSYKGKATDVRQIGRELGVRYVLEGSVRKLGTTLRVNARLISADTGAHLWSDRFDEDLKDLADGQQRVVARMLGGLGIGMVDIERTRSQPGAAGEPRCLRSHPAGPGIAQLTADTATSG